MKLYGSMAKYLPAQTFAGNIKRSFQEGLTVHELLKAIEIPPEEKIMVILVNSEDIMELDNGKDDKLHGGDIVEVFPPVIGG